MPTDDIIKALTEARQLLATPFARRILIEAHPRGARVIALAKDLDALRHAAGSMGTQVEVIEWIRESQEPDDPDIAILALIRG